MRTKPIGYLISPPGPYCLPVTTLYYARRSSRAPTQKVLIDAIGGRAWINAPETWLTPIGARGRVFTIYSPRTGKDANVRAYLTKEGRLIVKERAARKAERSLGIGQCGYAVIVGKETKGKPIFAENNYGNRYTVLAV